MRVKLCVLSVFLMVTGLFLGGCNAGDTPINQLSDLQGKTFAVPSGSIADKLVQTKFPKAKFQYFESAQECCLAVKEGKVDAAAYDEPILKNLTAQIGGLRVLPEKLTQDEYGFAVQLHDLELKKKVDTSMDLLKVDGTYNNMVSNWFPETGNPPTDLPPIELSNTNGTLRFGTAAITEPFAFKNAQGEIIGFDIELARRIAQNLEMDLEIVDMSFGEMLPSLAAGNVQLIGACISISEERAKTVLFTKPYLSGGIAVAVRE